MPYAEKDLTYPKTHCFFKRTALKKLDGNCVGKPEFIQAKYWHVTEKIDGMNIRVYWDQNEVFVAGRSNKAQLPKQLKAKLEQWAKDVHEHVMKLNNHSPVLFFGEGYGPGIQKNGENYAPEQSFRMFLGIVDDRFLEPEEFMLLCKKVNVKTVPSLGVYEGVPFTLPIDFKSQVTKQDNPDFKETWKAEGIVATAFPYVYDAEGWPLRFKLKLIDKIELPVQAMKEKLLRSKN